MPASASELGGEEGAAAGGSTRAVVSDLCELKDEEAEALPALTGAGAAVDAEEVPLLVPIGTVSRGGLTAGGTAPELVTRSVSGDIRVDLSL